MDWGKRNNSPAPVASAMDSSAVSYTLAASTKTFIPPATRDERDFPIAAMGAFYHIDSFNGYSSLGQRALEDILHCKRYSLILCALPPPALLKREPETHAMYLDLFKIDRILTEKGVWTKATLAHPLPGWSKTEQQNTVLFTRPKRITLPGTLSWHSPDIQVSAPAHVGGDGESFTVRNGGKAGLLVFARLFYPGFRARVGDIALKVRPVSGMLVGVEVPPKAQGTLCLSFLPPSFAPSLGAALMGLLLALALVFREEWKTRPA